MFQELFTWSEWALLYEAWPFYIIPERAPPSFPCCHLTALSQHFSIWEMEKKKCYLGLKFLLLVDVLVPDDLVGDPVEDVEDEECQRKGGPGDRVYPLGSVHELFPHGVQVFGDWRLRVWSRSCVFNSWAVLGWQGLTRIVASEIKAAFTHVFILENTHAQADGMKLVVFQNTAAWIQLYRTNSCL